MPILPEARAPEDSARLWTLLPEVAVGLPLSDHTHLSKFPLHSVNSFLIFQEAAHLTNGSEAPQDPDTRKSVSAGPSRGDMYYANASV